MEATKNEIKYAKSYKIGNTIINIIAPNITEEENERRWKHACDIATMIVERKMKMENGLKDLVRWLIKCLIFIPTLFLH